MTDVEGFHKIEFTDPKFVNKKIIIYISTTTFNSEIEGNNTQEKEKTVKDAWLAERTKLEKIRKDEGKALVANDILELAIKVFDDPNVRHEVVIDISDIPAWKLCPKNPAGWCPAQVQGIVVGNVGFFVSLANMRNQLIERLPEMGNEDFTEYLQSLQQILQSTVELDETQKSAIVAMLQEIINELTNK